MYLVKIMCAGLFLFILGIVLNVATLVTVINVAHEDSTKKIPADHIAQNVTD